MTRPGSILVYCSADGGRLGSASDTTRHLNSDNHGPMPDSRRKLPSALVVVVVRMRCQATGTCATLVYSMATAPTGAVPVKTYEPVLARKVSPPTLDFTCNSTDGAAGFSLAPAKGVGAELFGVTGVVSVSGATAVGASSAQPDSAHSRATAKAMAPLQWSPPQPVR